MTSHLFLLFCVSPPTKNCNRADDWDLATPLQTCTLAVERHDDILVLLLHSLQPKPGGPPGATEPVLFAQATVDLSQPNPPPLSSFCDPVIDSSRYFCLRIQQQTPQQQHQQQQPDAKAATAATTTTTSSSRTAHVGLGFRERDDASNFRLALQEYERSLERERVAEQLHSKYDVSDVGAQLESQLTLKEGETMHIAIKGRPSKEKDYNKPKSSSSSSTRPMLLRKPPPPSASGGGSSGVISGIDLEMVGKTLRAPSSRSFDMDPDDNDGNDDDGNTKTVDSGNAVADGFSVDNDDDLSRDNADLDDEWNDFQDGEQPAPAPSGGTM